MNEFVYEIFITLYDAIKYAVTEIISIIVTVSKTIYEGLDAFYTNVIRPIFVFFKDMLVEIAKIGEYVLTKLFDFI
jgi:hypothetical protein